MRAVIRLTALRQRRSIKSIRIAARGGRPQLLVPDYRIVLAVDVCLIHCVEPAAPVMGAVTVCDLWKGPLWAEIWCWLSVRSWRTVDVPFRTTQSGRQQSVSCWESGERSRHRRDRAINVLVPGNRF